MFLLPKLMDIIEKKIRELEKRFLSLKQEIGIDEQEKKFLKIQQEMSVCGFWSDRKKGLKKSKELGRLSNELQEWEEIGNDIKVLLQKPLLDDDYVKKKCNILSKKIDELEFISLFSGKYDNNDAIISIHAGTGGVDAQDWAQMLERMYLRFGEKKKWKTEILDRHDANEAGIKSSTMRVRGSFAYGYLKSENGVHRLLRISPFDGESLRQTSFVLVEVLPEIVDDEIKIEDSDLKIDFYKSSGPGGQSVNTTDSAVRITHLPSGIVLTCQNERSQKQNKDNALQILRSKLLQISLEVKEKQERKLKGELKKAEWGQRIRSYCLYGNRLVKDYRTNYETTDVDSVLDGGIDNFITAYLEYIR